MKAHVRSRKADSSEALVPPALAKAFDVIDLHLTPLVNYAGTISLRIIAINIYTEFEITLTFRANSCIYYFAIASDEDDGFGSRATAC